MDTAETNTRSLTGSPPHKKLRLDTSEGSSLAEISAPALSAATSSILPKALGSKQIKKGKKNKRPPPPEPCSPEDVNLRDVYEILGADAIASAVQSSAEYAAPIPLYTEVELKIVDISSHGAARISSNLPPDAAVKN